METTQLKSRGVIGGSKSEPPIKTPKLAESGIAKKTSSDAQHLADLKEKNPERYGKVLNGEVPLSKMRMAHVNNNSGEDEWFTPSYILNAARQAMGGFDLDPASTKLDNRAVQARKFFTKEQNGLTRPWEGRVWLNPPYSQPSIKEFSKKVIAEWSGKQIEQLCMLVNNATDTEWLQNLLRCEPAPIFCLLKGRVRFLNKQGEPANIPLQGQIVIYFGPRQTQFAHAFAGLGVVCGRF